MKRLFLLSFVAAFILVGCDNKSAAPDGPITLGKRKVSASFAAGSYSTAVKADCSWEATTADDWITITQGASSVGEEKSLDFTVTQNPTIEKRTGTITLSAVEEEYSTTLKVEQKPNEFTISISKIGDIPSVGTKKVTIEVVPRKDSHVFYYGFATKMDFNDHASAKAFMQWQHEERAYWVSTGKYKWSQFLTTGAVTKEYKGLYADCDYIAFAFLADMEGNLISEDLTYIEFTTK